MPGEESCLNDFCFPGDQNLCVLVPELPGCSWVLLLQKSASTWFASWDASVCMFVVSWAVRVYVCVELNLVFCFLFFFPGRSGPVCYFLGGQCSEMSGSVCVVSWEVRILMYFVF